MHASEPSGNRHIWNSPKVVEGYAADEALQKPEQTLLEYLRVRLPGMHMLDLGVGTGRTTRFFASLVREYIGADYAKNMVQACRKRFPDAGGHIRFEVLDATHMPEIPDQSIDLVLFSYNGIDYSGPEDREKIFQEVKRVCKPGGIFIFSSHNLLYVPQMYALKLHRRLKDFLYQFYRKALLLYYNGLPGQYVGKEYALLRDGDARFRLRVFYVHPDYQIRRLEALGFHNIKAYSLKTGAEIDSSKLGELSNDAWVYYKCIV